MEKFVSAMKVFYSFAARKRAAFVVFVLVTFVSSVSSSIIPYFLKLFVDGISNLNYKTLFQVLLLLILTRFVSLFSNMLSFFIGDIVIFDAAINARQKIFKHVQDLDFVFHTNKSTGYLISAFKRGDGAIWSIFHAIHHRFTDILIGFTVMIYFLNRIDPRITLLVFTSFVLAIFITALLVKINIQTRIRHNEEEDKVSAIIVDNMVNFETVKLFAKEGWELSRLKKAFVPWLKTGWQHVNTFRLIDFSIGTLTNISIFLTLFLSLNMARDGNLTAGDFALILGFVGSFYPRLFDLVWSFRDVGKNFADVEKYFGLLDYDIEVKDPEKPARLTSIRGEIEFKNVNFKYERGKREALNNINLKIFPGQSIALVGRSGSGKTTLIKLLMRFYDIAGGAITIDGIDIKTVSKSDLRLAFGVVPQEPILFNNTIGYNISYGKENAGRNEVVEAAKIANLHQFIETLPKKYETHVGERGIKLSGGQKQRLAIARMVLSNPDIIIFDEATSQLDSENEALIQDALWKVAKGKTVIIIAHRLTTAMRADKIIVVDKGKIIETGSHGELLGKDSLYKRFWDLTTNLIP